MVSDPLRVRERDFVCVSEFETPVGKGDCEAQSEVENVGVTVTESEGVKERVAVVVFVLVRDADTVFVDVWLSEGRGEAEAASEGAPEGEARDGVGALEAHMVKVPPNPPRPGPLEGLPVRVPPRSPPGHVPPPGARAVVVGERAAVSEPPAAGWRSPRAKAWRAR